MPTMGAFNRMAPVEPWKTASPKPKIPPSDATSQYPLPLGVAAIPTIGALRRMPPVEPWKRASPNEKTPPAGAGEDADAGAGRPRHAHDRRVQRQVAGRAAEWRAAEREDPAVSGDHPVAAVRVLRHTRRRQWHGRRVRRWP